MSLFQKYFYVMCISMNLHVITFTMILYLLNYSVFSSFYYINERLFSTDITRITLGVSWYLFSMTVFYFLYHFSRLC